MIKLETVKLRAFTLVRPVGKLGTCGFHPKAWSVAVMSDYESPTHAFLRVNDNWKPEEIEE